MYTDKLFTGQREMRRPEPVEGAGLGIYHYGARFYSPKLGRFLSADSIVPNPANPQAFNRYSYAYNNPLRYVDPSGHTPVCGFSYSDPECYAPDPWVPSPPYIPPGGGGGNGWVEIYKNGALIGRRNLSAWEFSSSGGYIGMLFYHAWDAVVDDFGGGTAVSGGESMMAFSGNSPQDSPSVGYPEFTVSTTELNLKANANSSILQGMPSSVGPRPY